MTSPRLITAFAINIVGWVALIAPEAPNTPAAAALFTAALLLVYLPPKDGRR